MLEEIWTLRAYIERLNKKKVQVSNVDEMMKTYLLRQTFLMGNNCQKIIALNKKEVVTSGKAQVLIINCLCMYNCLAGRPH